MSISFTCSVENGILKVKATGRDDHLEQVKEYGLAILKAAVESSCTKVLCDESELEYRLGTFNTFESAKFIAEKVPRLAKVAIVCRKAHLPEGKFWETVANNRGLRVLVCSSLQEAEKWLS